MKPVVSEEQYNKTEVLVADFGKQGGEGDFLQQKLKEYAERKDNWVMKIYFNMDLT